MVDDAKNLKKMQSAINDGSTFIFRDLDMVTCTIFGRPINFVIGRQRDHIQRQMRHGRFYEAEELEVIRQNFQPGGVFVDIGANIGNHSLFVASFLSPSKVVPFEPNPEAYTLLVANVAANGVGHCFDLSKLGFGVSDHQDDGFSIDKPARNLGAGRMVKGEGNISTVVADDALADIVPDFIKIDVEGMEMDVLNGLRDTLERARPKIFVEVDNDNADAFDNWLCESGYVAKETLVRYASNKNYLLVPGTRDV